MKMWWLLSHDPAWSPTPLVAQIQPGGPTSSSAGWPVGFSLISFGTHRSAKEQDAPPMDCTVNCVPWWPARLQCALTVPHCFPAAAAPPSGVNPSAKTMTAISANRHVLPERLTV